MRFTIKERVLCENLPKEVMREIKNYLTITNPTFSKQIQMQKSVWGIKQYISYYWPYPGNADCLYIPTGALPYILDLVQDKFKISIAPEQVIDNRVKKSDASFFKNAKFTATLRDYQEDAKNALLDCTVGVLKAKTGSGKTVIVVATILDRRQNTLILVNTRELADQMRAAIVEFTNIKEENIGLVGESIFKVKPITIGILQTVTILGGEKLKKVQESFGQVVADETHIIAAETYFEAMSKLPAKYTCGVSATPYREDGLTNVIHWATGPLIYEVPDHVLDKFLITPDYEHIETNYHFPMISTDEYQDLVTDMAEDAARNELIYTRFKKEKEIPSIFLCSRVSQVQTLVKKIGKSAVMLTSKMSKKDRKEAMRKLHSGEALHVVSTWGLFSTGIDVPKMQRLYACGPMGSETKLRQAGGRLMRTSKGKIAAKVVDFADPQNWVLKKQIKKRIRIFKTL